MTGNMSDQEGDQKDKKKWIIMAAVGVAIIIAITVVWIVSAILHDRDVRRAQDYVQQMRLESNQLALQVEPLLIRLQTLRNLNQGSSQEAIELTNRICDLWPTFATGIDAYGNSIIQPLDQCFQAVYDAKNPQSSP